MAGSRESDGLSDVPNHPKLCTTLEGLTQAVHVSLQHRTTKVVLLYLIFLVVCPIKKIKIDITPLARRIPTNKSKLKKGLW